MNNLRELTSTINTFVRFFESINCLFWQIQWLEQNVTRAQGIEGLGRILLVVIFVSFCIFYTFACADNENCQDKTIQIGIITLLILTLLYLLWQRYRLNRIDRPIRDHDVEAPAQDREKLISHATPVFAPAYVINEVESMSRSRKY